MKTLKHLHELGVVPDVILHSVALFTQCGQRQNPHPVILNAYLKEVYRSIVTKNENDNDGVVFLAPDAAPPAQVTRAAYTRWNAVRDQLATKPGVWAVVLEIKEGEPGYSSVHGKKIALSKNRPDVEAEIRTENGVRRLYARFVA